MPKTRSTNIRRADAHGTLQRRALAIGAATSTRPVAPEVLAEDSSKERIMKVAAELFSLQGFAGTTMAEIADAVGIRSPSLYYHFKDKANILEAIANLTMDIALADSGRMVQDKDHSIPQRFYLLVRDLVFRLCESAYDLDCMFDPAFHRDEFKTVNTKLKVWLKDLEYLIKAGTAEGVFAPQSPRVAAYSVRGLIIAAIRKMGGYSVLSSADRADYVARFAVKGLILGPSDFADIDAGFPLPK